VRRYRTQEVAGSSPASSTHKARLATQFVGDARVYKPPLIYLCAPKLWRELGVGRCVAAARTSRDRPARLYADLDGGARRPLVFHLADDLGIRALLP
jgi:hypothetical protein